MNDTEDDPKPWMASDGGSGEKRFAPATLRNRDAIVEVLQETLPKKGMMLEIASGSGEHAIYFAEKFPDVDWQPSDPDPDACNSIDAWRTEKGLANVAAALQLDTRLNNWPELNPSAILCINMVHISPWEASIGLFDKAAALLEPGTPLYLYGAYFRDDMETAESNLAFDRNLKSRNLQWGIRELTDVDALAKKKGFERTQLVEMPANNLSLVYRKS